MPAAPSVWYRGIESLPVYISQVREDALLDLWALDRVRLGARVLMIASGGCTAAALAATRRVSRLVFADSNPAQVALSRLKLKLLAEAPPQRRLELLGHAPMKPEKRLAELERELGELRLKPEVLGPPEVLAERGPDFAGRYELLWAAFQRELRGRAAELEELLRLREPAEQARRLAPAAPLGAALDAAAARIIDGDAIAPYFWPGENFRTPFHVQIAEGLRRHLSCEPARGNPYAAQMLLGRFVDGALLPWLSSPAPDPLPETAWAAMDIGEIMRRLPAHFDLIHLSNVPELLGADKAAELLGLAWRSLRPGGLVLVRQLDSVVDLLALESPFRWLSEEGRTLQRKDRSAIYRDIHVGLKP